jgi:hypothetical protein
VYTVELPLYADDTPIIATSSKPTLFVIYLFISATFNGG